MNEILLNKIRNIKKELEQEGFIILGIFGSYARGEETIGSDIDILYDLEKKFKEKYKGLAHFGKIFDIKKYIEETLGLEVDIANKNALKDSGKKYILPEVIYVNYL